MRDFVLHTGKKKFCCLTGILFQNELLVIKNQIQSKNGCYFVEEHLNGGLPKLNIITGY